MSKREPKDYLTLSDIGVLRSAGFTAGWSGQSWFYVDPNYSWQATLNDNDTLLFEARAHQSGQSLLPQHKLTREEFDAVFGRAFNPPATDTGD